MPTSATTESLDEAINRLPAPDLTDEQSAADYRSGVLVAIVRQLQVLHLRSPDNALHLHNRIVQHLWALHAIGLLSDERVQLGFEDLTRAYHREHPGLLEHVVHD
ncbi:hypothetical protein D3C85_1540250 [compost metagenome]